MLSLLIAAAGCVSSRRFDPSPPIKKFFSVEANKGWQDSSVRVRRGYVVRCEPEGQWGDFFLTCGPEGNREVYKDIHMIRAPAFALLMKISSSTNLAYYMPGPTNIIAERSGTLMFRSNSSLPSEMRGTMKVTITALPDTDGDGVSDYEEVFLFSTDPTVPDTNGSGFPDSSRYPRP